MTTILIKSKNTSGEPAESDLTVGNNSSTFGSEIAVNTADQKIYTKNVSGSVVELSPALHAYPVGSIYISTEATNPSGIFGGTWEVFSAGRVLVGAGSGYTAGTEGGNTTFELTADNLPKHKHNTNIRFEGDDAAVIDTTLEFDSGISGQELDHNADNNAVGNTTRTQANLKADDSTNQTVTSTSIDLRQPYLVVYMFKRTA
jgi:hypothetical protein